MSRLHLLSVKPNVQGCQTGVPVTWQTLCLTEVRDCDPWPVAPFNKRFESLDDMTAILMFCRMEQRDLQSQAASTALPLAIPSPSSPQSSSPASWPGVEHPSTPVEPAWLC
jgi:hypothetical protein